VQDQSSFPPSQTPNAHYLQYHKHTLVTLFFAVLLLTCPCRPAGGWRAPKTPLLAVPLNMTAGYSMWQNMDAALAWTQKWAKGKPTLARRL